MPVPVKPVVFVVDLVNPSIGFVEIKNASYMCNLDGDLIFMSADETAVEMVARGHWTRVKMETLTE